jgi:hypothetical protein
VTSGGKNPPPNGEAPPVQPTPPAPKPTERPHTEDPAHTYIIKDIVYFETLNAVLTKGKDGGVNWEEAAGKGGRASQSTYWVVSMLQSEFDNFRVVATSDEPSQTLLNAFTTALQVLHPLFALWEKLGNWYTNRAA